MRTILSVSFFSAFSFQCVKAQTDFDSTKKNKWTTHFQITVITQAHSGFKSLYSGPNSLADSVESGETSITSTLFFGRKLWKGAAVYFNPEISGGRGLSSASGVAGALNGETYRIGDPSPSAFIARLYFQQYIPIGNTGYEYAEHDVNQVAEKIPVNRITIRAGKFAISDFYDKNRYSHDPRTQFFNWSIMSNGSWDYPANTRGYTMGMIVEYSSPKWTILLSSVAVPRIANASFMEYNITKAHSETFEIERKLKIKSRPGSLRFTISNTHSKAPSYSAGMKALATGDNYTLDVISGNEEGKCYGGKKFGLGLSADQELTNEIGIFARAGWNDGKYATWAFTEIDQTLNAGISIKGNKWNCSDDVFGFSGVVNGISSAHRNFLKAGGHGFIIGDGNLNYGNELVLETYYSARFSKFLWVSFNYQFVNNPAYNKDRGPVHVFGIRAHVEF